MTKLGASQRLSGSIALARALRDGPKTFGDLWPEANTALGYHRDDYTAPGYRFTDAWLQRHRKLKHVSFMRTNRATKWSFTDVGRQHFEFV
jgi:hypothetical protein